MLFGHQSDTNTTSQPVGTPEPSATNSTANPLAVDPSTGSSFPATSSDNSPAVAPTSMSDTPSSFDNPLSDESTPSVDLSTPTTSDTSAPMSMEPSMPAEDTPTVPTADTNSGNGDELLSLKQEALGQLAPLVDHLEQSPEEKFKTTMMMLQSTDNQALIKDAYAAAQAIPDEKARAQALLDVVNEINYFTQKSQQ